MTFEVELLNERIDVSEDEVWTIISMYWVADRTSQNLSAFAINKNKATDIRRYTKSHRVFFGGIDIDIVFINDAGKFIFFGEALIGGGPFARHEHILGYIEVRPVMISAVSPVDVRIVCCWEPFYVFFRGMADAIITAFNQIPKNQAFNELLKFKVLVERQTHRDIFVNDKPQENLARAFLQTFLEGRSYREVPVRGGQSDILVFTKEGRFLYETKIWRGPAYFNQGLREIEEYIIGEDNDGLLQGIFYVVFDSTASGKGSRYRKSDITDEIIVNRTVTIIIINLHPPTPSQK